VALKIKAFTLIELLVVVAIIGILAAVGVNTFTGFQEKAKISATKANHKTIVKFITVSVARCSIGDELILKYSYDLNTKKFTYTKDLCPYVNSGNASYMAGAFVYHFKSPVWCNPMGWKHNSGTCMEAAETSGTVGEGTPGATKFITSSGSSSTLIIDTKYTCEPLALTEICHGQGKSLTDSIKIE